MSQRNKPKCTICRAHNVISDFKGHKYKCAFRDCNCDLCQVKSICLGKKGIINLVLEEQPPIPSEKEEEVVEIRQILISDKFQEPILLLENNSYSVIIGNTLFSGFALIPESKFN